MIPALKTAHTLAQAIRMAPAMSPDRVLLVNLSGRGDRDVTRVAALMRAARKENARGGEGPECSLPRRGARRGSGRRDHLPAAAARGIPIPVPPRRCGRMLVFMVTTPPSSSGENTGAEETPKTSRPQRVAIRPVTAGAGKGLTVCPRLFPACQKK
ncbi:hypothetical protein [uncultured Desulfovibrio sp.]|uniref:hypothetical protein n=1 Tax=uncultured Desulfovibrio sp. TaxID=167968 RepID=UPI002637DAC6|nr:hypothetical protein [uncultured Desulfovibrio sp.]